MKEWQNLFDTHRLVHNIRTKKIVISNEKDGAFAVVDIDTLWVDIKGRETIGRGEYVRYIRKWRMSGK